MEVNMFLSNEQQILIELAVNPKALTEFSQNPLEFAKKYKIPQDLHKNLCKLNLNQFNLFLSVVNGTRSYRWSNMLTYIKSSFDYQDKDIFEKTIIHFLNSTEIRDYRFESDTISFINYLISTHNGNMISDCAKIDRAMLVASDPRLIQKYPDYTTITLEYDYAKIFNLDFLHQKLKTKSTLHFELNSDGNIEISKVHQ